jgi:Flp pilus assembly protein TadG
MRAFARIRREDGQAAAEMALVLPILLMVILAIVQFGITLNNYITLTDATRAGARKASVARFTGDFGASAKTLVKSDASNLSQSKLGVNVSITSGNWSTPGSEVAVTATYPYSIDILGITVKSGTLTSTSKERLE